MSASPAEQPFGDPMPSLPVTLPVTWPVEDTSLRDLRPTALGGRSLVAVWILLSAWSLLTSHIPAVNEPHYLAKARFFADPGWCDADFFLQSANAHFCFYWLVAPLTQVMSLPAVAVTGRLVSLAVVAWGWWRLARSLQLSHRALGISSALLLVCGDQASFSGEWIVGGFESKVGAWGLGLAGLSFWVDAGAASIHRTVGLPPNRPRRVRYLIAGVLMGGSISLHPVVGVWCVVATSMAECLIRLSSLAAGRTSATSPGWRATPLSICLWCFPLCCFKLPSPPEKGEKVEKVAEGRMRGFSVIRAAFKTLNAVGWRGLSQFSGDAGVFLGAALTVALPGLIPALRLLQQGQTTRKEADLANFIQVFWRLKHHLDPTEFPLSAWCSAACLCCMPVMVVCWLDRRANSEQQRAAFRRLSTLLAMAGLIAAAGVLIGWHTVPAREMQGWEWRAALLKFYPFRLFDGLLCATAALSAGVWYQIQNGTPAAQRVRGGAAFVAVLLLGTLGVQKSQSVSPNGYTAEQFADWQETCEWIRHHTPREALFLTPRESFGFKWYADRAEYVAYKDCPQDSAGILEWNRRLWYLNGWTLRSSSDGLYDTPDLMTLRAETNVDYIVTRILGPFEKSPEYAGKVWQVYRVPELRPKE